MFIRVTCIVLLLLASTAFGEEASTCREAVKAYLSHRAIIANATGELASKRSDVAEAHRCTQHPPSTATERAMDKLTYMEYCIKWAKRANDDLLVSTSTFVDLEGQVVAKAVHAKDACVQEASISSKNPAEFPVRLLFITGLEVLRNIADDYRADALHDFTNYIEITVRRGYALYRRLIGRVLTNTKHEDTDFHALSSAPPLPHTKVPIFEVIVKLIRISIPDHLATAAQLAGIALGPVLLIGVLSATLVLFFPILFGYIVLGRVVFQFWVRALLLEGTLSQHQQHGSALVAFASNVVGENPLEVFMFASVAVGIIFLTMLVAFPWCMALWSLLDVPRTPQHIPTSMAEKQKKNAKKIV